VSKIGTVLLSTLIVWVIVCSLMPAAVHAEAPLISNVTAAVTENTAGISWLTNTNATGNVEYGTDPGPPYPNTAPFVVDTTADHTMHAVVLFGLGANSTYYYRVKSHDGNPANETTSSEHSFTTKAFTISEVTHHSITTNSATITWNTTLDDAPLNATSNVEYGETTGYGSVAPSPPDTTADHASHVVVLSDLLPNTTYHYRVKSKDALGSEEVYADQEFTTSADTTPPVILDVDAADADITDTTAIVRWNTDELATSQVAYSTTSHPGDYPEGTTIADVLADYGSWAEEDTTPLTSHMVVLDGLTPESTYHYRVISKDGATPANEAVSPEATFDTTADITPPVISNIASSVTTTTAIITWDTDELATSNVEYGLDDTYELSAPVPADTLADNISHTVALSGLLPNTTYHYQVKSSDAYGNPAALEDKTFTTQADITPPVISNIASSVTTTTAIITWDTDELATSNVEYGLDDTYELSAPVPADTLADNISHTVALSGLLPNTTYHYQVKSSDAYGNPAALEDKTFTTEVDTDPPLAPELYSPPLDPRPHAETPIFDWSDVDDPSGVTYSLQVDDNHLFSSPEIDETGLTDSSCTSRPALPDGDYYWRVRAVDGATPTPNKSGWTSVRQFTIDTTGPDVMVISPNGGEFWAGDSTQDITWTATDPHMAVNPINIEYYNGTTWVPIATGEVNDGAYEWTVPNLDTPTAKVKVTAIDALGNTDSDESDDNFTIDSTPPEVEIDQLEFHPATPFVTPTFTGTATDSVSPIDSVEYRVLAPDETVEIDWTPAEPVDGAFDSPTEDFTFTTSALAEGWHLLEVRATDAAGNEAVSDDYSFAPDITPPVISNVTASDVTKDSVVISWTTDEPATSQVEYGETTEYGLVSEESITLTTEHSVTITGLDSGTGYHFRVKSTDAAGNEAVSDDYTFTTTAVAIGWLRILLIVIGVVAVGLVVFFVVRRVFAQAGKRA